MSIGFKKILAYIIALICMFCVLPTFAEADEKLLLTNVMTSFDGKNYRYPILHIDEYPAMAVEELAKVIGAKTSGGNTISKNGKTLTFTPYNRLAEDFDGHIMLERSPVMCGGKLYVPISFIKPYFKYNMFYDRFGKTLEITSGINYTKSVSAKNVYKVKDFGAVGDGITYDGRAVTKAINEAQNCGKSARVEFEAGKTYLIEERMDSVSYFTLEDAKNLTIEGNGATILFDTPTNTFMHLNNCTNVKINNLSVDYKEPCASQGRIISVDKESGSFNLQIDEGFPLPADDEWVKYYIRDDRTGGWWFGQLYDASEPRMKYTGVDNLFVDSVIAVDNENRIYKVTVKGGATGSIKWAEVNDRFVLNTRYSSYAMGDYNISSDGSTESNNWKAYGSTSALWLNKCTDCEFNNFYVYSTGHMFCGIGFSEGKTTFINSGFKVKDDRLLCANSDGIHTWFNRGALVLENCTFENNLDDHINTYTQGGFISKIVDSRTFETQADLNGRVGDEIQVYNQNTKQLLGRAFIKEYEKIPYSNSRRVTLDRDFKGIDSLETTQTPSILYNIDSGSRGNSISGCTFNNSRRYAVLNRSANTLFENNTINGCGAGIATMNELTNKTKSEGGFPSSTTIRNNTVTSEGNTYGYYPLEIRHWKAQSDSSRAIDGILVEGNIFNVPNTLGAMTIDSVNDLYLINNEIIGSDKVRTATLPVRISNCNVKKIDGLQLDYASKVNSAIDLIACNVDENDITNIKGSTTNYRVLPFEHITENFETEDLDNLLGEYMTVKQTMYSDINTYAITRQNGGKALEIKRSGQGNDYKDNLILSINLRENNCLQQSNGILNFEFDAFVDPNVSATRVDFIDSDSNKQTRMYLAEPSKGTDKAIVKAVIGREAEGGELISEDIGTVEVNSWHRFKISIDYAESRISYYVDDEYITSFAFSKFYTAPNGEIWTIEIVAWDEKEKSHIFDNIDIWYEEYTKPDDGIKIREFKADKSINDGKEVLDVTAVMSAGEQEEVELLAAFYKDGGLISAESRQVILLPNDKYLNEIFNLPDNDVVDEVKVFIWNVVGGYIPAAECQYICY